MEVVGGDYRVGVDSASRTAVFSGTLRLNGTDEYAPILQMLDDLLDTSQGSNCTWDLRELQFLNSSGINMLYQLVIKARRLGNINMHVVGSKDVAWQGKSLGNMSRFMPGLELTVD